MDNILAVLDQYCSVDGWQMEIDKKNNKLPPAKDYISTKSYRSKLHRSSWQHKMIRDCVLAVSVLQHNVPHKALVLEWFIAFQISYKTRPIATEKSLFTFNLQMGDIKNNNVSKANSGIDYKIARIAINENLFINNIA